MTTTLGGVTLRDPNSHPDGDLSIYRVFVGQQNEAHNGTLKTDFTADKLGFRIKWTLLTAAERDTIITRAEVRTAQVFKPPHTATTYTVLVRPETLVERPVYFGNETRYDVDLSLEEES